VLENRVYLISTVSMSRANRSNVMSIHPSNSNIRSIVSVIVMLMDEKSRHSSVALFSMQTLTISNPTFIKLFLYSFCNIL